MCPYQMLQKLAVREGLPKDTGWNAFIEHMNEVARKEHAEKCGLHPTARWREIYEHEHRMRNNN